MRSEPPHIDDADISAAVEKCLAEISQTVSPRPPLEIIGESVNELLDRLEVAGHDWPTGEEEVDAALEGIFDVKDTEPPPSPNITLDTIQEGGLPKEVAELFTTEPEGIRVAGLFGRDTIDALVRQSFQGDEGVRPIIPEKVITGMPMSAGVIDAATYLKMKPLGTSRDRELQLVCRLKDDGSVTACVLVRLALKSKLAWRAKRDRFVAEAAISEQIDHPGFVGALEAGLHEGRPFFVRSFVSGANLSKLMSLAGGPLSMPVVCEIGRQVAGVLRFLHERADPSGVPLELVHGALSPYDVFISFDGGVKIAEVGLTRLHGRQLRTVTGGRAGHARYAAPEQKQGWPIDGRTDLFSLGLVMTELLSGEPMGLGKELRLDQLDAEVFRRLGKRDDVPGALLDLLSCMLKPVPESRPASAADVVDELMAILQQHGGPPSLQQEILPYFTLMTPVVQMPRESVPAEIRDSVPPAPQKKRSPVGWVVAFVFLLAAGAVLAYFVTRT